MTDKTEEFLALTEEQFETRLPEAIEHAASLSFDGDVPERALDFFDRFLRYPEAAAEVSARRGASNG